jgi:hypothetical protein
MVCYGESAGIILRIYLVIFSSNIDCVTNYDFVFLAVQNLLVCVENIS